MSAFIVEDKIINMLVSFVDEVFNDRGPLKGYSIVYFQRKYIILNELLNKGKQALGQALFDLNCDAIEQRYGKGQAKEFRPLDYKYSLVSCISLYQLVKSIKCYLYQCTEGDVDESGLYKEVEGLVADLCERIVCSCKEYENAQW